MDMTKELEQVQIENNDSVLSMRKLMEKDRDNLEKKIYIFRAIEIANAIVEMVETELEYLHSRDVYGVAIWHYLDTDFDRHRFHFGSIDKNQKIKNDFTLLSNPKYARIMDLFSPNKGFGYAPECCRYGDSGSKPFMFSEKENLRENLLNFLLSDELKSIFDYNVMQLSLGKDNKVKPKSSKI